MRKIKNFLLKIALCATAILATAGFIAPITVNAEESITESVVESVSEGVESVETSEAENVPSEEVASENHAEIVEETETSKWFDETLKPLLLQFGAEIAAFLAVAWLWLRKFGKAKDAFGNAVDVLTQSNTENTNTEKAVKELRAENARHEAEMDAKMERMAEMFMNGLKALQETLGDKVADIDVTAHKLLDVEKLAYCNNSTLVSNGTAKRIAEVVGYGKTENENKD